MATDRPVLTRTLTFSQNRCATFFNGAAPPTAVSTCRLIFYRCYLAEPHAFITLPPSRHTLTTTAVVKRIISCCFAVDLPPNDDTGDEGGRRGPPVDDILIPTSALVLPNAQRSLLTTMVLCFNSAAFLQTQTPPN